MARTGKCCVRWSRTTATIFSVPGTPTHQRIYDNVVGLGSLGINVRGRSAKLTLNYRTSRQIIAAAMAVVHGQTYDDLDGGVDGLEGYRSVLRWPKSTFQGFTSQTAELEAVVGQAVE